MKNILLFASAFLVVLAVSCRQQQPKTSYITGRIDNLETGFALITFQGVTDTVWTQSDGTFEASQDILYPSYFTFRIGRNSRMLFLNPGGKINIHIDAKEPAASPRYNGDNTNENNYLTKANAHISMRYSDMRTLYSMSKETFEQKLDSVQNEVLNLLKQSNTENNDFIALEKWRIKYRNLNLLLNYPRYNASLSGIEFVWNQDDYKFMDEIDFNNIKHISMFEYQNLILTYIQQFHSNQIASDEHKGKSEFERMLMFYEIVDSLSANQTIRDFLKYSTTLESIQWANFEVGKNVAEHYISHAKTLVYKELIEKALANRMLLAPGADAPSFSLLGIDGKTYSLTDFRGSLVYLDFWASWCRPCLAEIPHLLKLKEAYADKKVAFVAISLDDDKAAWERMVGEKQLKGYQLHAEKAWSSAPAKDYQIKGVPTFILIDAEGKIIEYNAPRPSNPEINLLLDKHLKHL